MPYILDEHDKSAALFDIARGYYSNAKPVNLFGFNALVGSTYETIFNDGGGLYSFPSSEAVLSVVSDSTDTVAIRITGVDESYTEVSEDVTLNGTTAVSTTQAFYRINDCRTLNGNNVGNITVTNGSDTVAYIGAGLGVHQAAIYSVPKNTTLYIHSVSFTSGTVNPNKYLFGRAKVTNSGVSHLFWESTWAVGLLSYALPMPFVVPEKTDFSIQVKSSSGENEVSVYINAHRVTGE